MPGRKEYNLSLGEKFPGGRKNWEHFNSVIINKMMDQGLAIFIDIATALHSYMQSSLQECQQQDASRSGDEPPRDALSTPATRRLGRELRRLDADASDAEASSSAAAVASAATDDLTITHPLQPSHLLNPAYAAHWKRACEDGDTDFLDGLDVEATLILSDHKKDYNDLSAMKATDDAHLKKRQDNLLAQIFRTICRQFVNSMIEAFIKTDDQSPEQDALKSILLSKEMKDVALVCADRERDRHRAKIRQGH